MTLKNNFDARTNQGMPEGRDLQRQIAGRHRNGRIWLVVFQFSLAIAIVALTVLIINIINQTFGLVAIENEIEPEQLVSAYVEGEMETMPNTVSSEDDAALAASIAADPYAIGFFGYTYYHNQGDALRALAINGVEPGAASVQDGSYELTRPLFLYTGQRIMEAKPQVAPFIDFYLNHVNDEIADVGYFPMDPDALAEQSYALRIDEGATPPEALTGDIIVSGSSTVYPLTVRMAERYKEAGFQGNISVESVGTKAGYAALCVDKSADIADASRAMSRQEQAVCNKKLRNTSEFQVGTDALAVVVSSQNDFARDVTEDELRQIFNGARQWSDVRAGWPDQPIMRYIPSIDSGTLDFFVEKIYTEDIALSDLPKPALISTLEANLSKGVMRRYESEQPLAERSYQDLYDLVLEQVVEPRVIMSWNMLPSIFDRPAIEAEVLASNPDAHVQWRAWLNPKFLTATQSSTPEYAGVRTAILGTLWVILIVILFSVPVGIGAAIYLEEYAGQGRINRILQTNIDNLAGVPSIIYGILGLAIFVRALEHLTSGKLFGVADPTTANGRTILSAGLTLGLLVLPIIIINAQEALRAVPQSLRDAGYGLGATKWQVIRTHVLANALPGILTGAILGISRAIGETAPLVVIGASTFITVDPTSPFAKFTVLPMQIYQWTTRPQAEFKHIAAAASIVLLILMLLLNATAIYMRNRYSKTL